MSEAFHSELLKIAGNHIDVAFMLLDPRQGKDFLSGNWMILCIWWELILCFPCISGEILA